MNLSRVVNDPRLAEYFAVQRSSGHFAPGGWVEDAPTTLTLYGVVTPSSADELQQLPEGDRVTGNQTFYSASQIYVTHMDPQPGTSDIITYRGLQYRLAMVWDYSIRGYWKAIGVRILGQ